MTAPSDIYSPSFHLSADFPAGGSHALSSICELPPELLAVIFSFVEEDRGNAPVSNIIKVTHVCRWWRTIALQYPNLWSTIRHTGLAWTSILLDRSGATGLRISFVLDQPGALGSVRQIVKHSNRVREFCVKGMSNDIDEVMNQLPDELLLLEIWEMKNTSRRLLPPSTGVFRCKAPRLRHFCLGGFACDWSSHLFHGLTSLRIHNTIRGTKTTPDVILSVLAMSPQLTKLVLRCIFDERDAHEAVAFAHRKIELPLLDYLVLAEDHRTSSANQMIMLEHLSWPSTADIAIYCQIFDVTTSGRLFDCIRAMTYRFDITPIKAVGLTFTGVVTRFEGWTNSGTDRAHIHLSLLCMKMHSSLALPKVLCQMLPLAEVEILQIPGFVLGKVADVTWLELLQCFPCVRRLDVEYLPLALATAIGETSRLSHVNAEQQGDPSFERHGPAVPSLHTVVIQKGERTFKADGVLDSLIDSLSKRSEAGAGIACLELNDYLPTMDAKLEYLRDVVPRVVVVGPSIVDRDESYQQQEPPSWHAFRKSFPRSLNSVKSGTNTLDIQY